MALIEDIISDKVQRIERALEVLGSPNAITFSSDWQQICDIACAALNRVLSEFKNVIDR